ncbi:Crp/Fnr family transcriptional regulator [Sulfuricystis multivorans]|uniref:Crp/Fnr family transcriptional regulator n=1 Tax=Sulfuricystis multivorans TaxID=2211108 RepID=UPI0024DF53BB|nr:Crp/Fnr family transcriptional regulator [Sulfuricystis multivorans]
MFPAYFPHELVRRARLRSLRRGEVLFSFGDRIDSLHRVVEGQLSLVHLLPDGGELVLMRTGADQFIAECSVCANEYTCEARADKESLVASLPMAEFDRWLIQDGSFARAWAMDLARRLKDQFIRYQRLSLRNARDRILHFLHSEADTRGVVSLPGSYADWAAELGLTKETLYRALAALEDEAVLSRDGRWLTILESPLRRGTRRER